MGFDERKHGTTQDEYGFGAYNAYRYFNFANGDCSNDTYDTDPLGCVTNSGAWTETRIKEDPFGCVDKSKTTFTDCDSAGTNYWGWQARPVHSSDTTGLCHVSYGAGDKPLDNKTDCENEDSTNYEWYGEAGAACLYARNTSKCFEFLPLFDGN